MAPFTVDAELLAALRCPITGRPLRLVGDRLITDDGSRSYAISGAGIPLLGDGMSDDAIAQQRHYDRVAAQYTENLTLEHTRAYMQYLNRETVALIGDAPLMRSAEICCGAGEAFNLFGFRIDRGIGVDVSGAMLERARAAHPGRHRLFVQGDAVRLPLADGQFDAVFMLGGIHHVNARDRLFGELHRILRPGGRLFLREPVDDFLPWRLARSVVYRWSPSLEPGTEHPLRRRDTERQLAAAGFAVTAWRTLGFLGYCLLMNSDVLAINRIWARVPGTETLTRAAARLDDIALKVPGLRSGGALAIGSAVRR